VIATSISGSTRWLSVPRGWEPETDGQCGRLAIRDEVTMAGPLMASAWEPTPEELGRLNKGAKVILRVVGYVHPLVSVLVGNADSD
jgi:hypothetical protein